MRVSKKYSFSIISFFMLFSSVGILYLDPVKSLGLLYGTILTALLMICVLVVSVSYLTGQAKIDLEATYGKDSDQD